MYIGVINRVEALRSSAPNPYFRSYFKMAYHWLAYVEALKPGFMVTNIRPIEDFLIGSSSHHQVLTWQIVNGRIYYTAGRQNCALQITVMAYHEALLSEKDNFEKRVKELKESDPALKEAQRRLTHLMDVYSPLTGVLVRNRDYVDFAVEPLY